MKVDWKGVLAVVVTPFDVNGAIQENDLREMVKILINDGVHGFIAAASTGEYYVMNDEERIRVFEIVSETAKSIKPDLTLIANITAINTYDAVKLGKAATKLEYDGVMVLPPYYATPSQQQIIEHYKIIGGNVDLPIMLYNAPKWTGIDLNPDYLEKLLEIENICAIKESSRNMEQVLEDLRLFHDRLRVFIGLETLTLPAIVLGADGVVAMAVQAMGRRIVEMYDLCVAGRWEEARKIQYEVSLIYNYNRQGTHYAALKEMINQVGRPAGYPRRPLTLPDEKGKKEITKLLQAVNLLP